MLGGAGANQTQARLNRELAKLPVIRFMEKHEPELYGEVMRNMERIVTQRPVDPFAHAHEVGSTYGAQLLRNYALLASDDSIFAFARLARDAVARLERENDGTCLRFIHNDAEGLRRAARIVPDFAKKAGDVSAEMLHSAAERPQAAPDRVRYTELAEQIGQRAERRVGQTAMEQLVSAHTKTVAQQQLACRAYLAIMDELLRLDRASLSIVMRTSLAQAD